MNSMAGWIPLALATILYLWQSTEYLVRRDYAIAFVFFGYALANLGFIWDFMRRYG